MNLIHAGFSRNGFGSSPIVAGQHDHMPDPGRPQVHPFDPEANSGTGWTFDHADGGAFRGAVGNAMYTYRRAPTVQNLI